jgi:hypothetical protein
MLVTDLSGNVIVLPGGGVILDPIGPVAEIDADVLCAAPSDRNFRHSNHRPNFKAEAARLANLVSEGKWQPQKIIQILEKTGSIL